MCPLFASIVSRDCHAVEVVTPVNKCVPTWDIFKVKRPQRVIEHIFSKNKTGSSWGDLLYVVFRRTGSLSGEKCFPTGDLLGGAAPNPRRLPASFLLKREEKLSLQLPGPMCPLEIFPLVADFFDLRFQLLFFHELLVPQLPEMGSFL